MKRRRLEPDSRPDWRNRDMPVIGKSGREIDHNKMNIKAQIGLQSPIEPTWRNDPTYNLRRSK